MPDELLDQRLQLVISKGQIRDVDDWRRLQPDLPSRSEAIRRLIDAGLKTNPVAPEGSGDPGPSTRGKLGPSRVPRAKKPAPERKAEPAEPRSKLDQIRALREQGAR